MDEVTCEILKPRKLSITLFGVRNNTLLRRPIIMKFFEYRSDNPIRNRAVGTGAAFNGFEGREMVVGGV